MKDDLPARTIADILSVSFPAETKKKLKKWEKLDNLWNKACGEQLATHSGPVDLKNSILVIEADHQGWIQLLMLKQKLILEAIKKAFPELTLSGISFRLKKDLSLPGSCRREDGSEEKIYSGLSESPIEETGSRSAAEIIDSIEDEEFKKVLESFAKTLLSKNT